MPRNGFCYHPLTLRPFILALSLSLSFFLASCRKLLLASTFSVPPSHTHSHTHTLKLRPTFPVTHRRAELSLSHTLSPPFLAFNLSCNRSYSRIRTPVSSGLGSRNCCLRTTLDSLSVQELSSTIMFIQLLHQSIFTH